MFQEQCRKEQRELACLERKKEKAINKKVKYRYTHLGGD